MPMMFLEPRKLGNICCGHKMFLNKIRNIFVSRTQNLCPQQMLRTRANGETFVSATMCPQQCVLVCQGLSRFFVGNRKWKNVVANTTFFTYLSVSISSLVKLLAIELKQTFFFSFEIFTQGTRPGGGDYHTKQTGMLVVSLRGVNFGFWSPLGCSGQSVNILCRQGLV